MCVDGVNSGGCNTEGYKSVSGCNRPAIGFQNKSVGHKAKEEGTEVFCVCVCGWQTDIWAPKPAVKTTLSIGLNSFTELLLLITN